MAVQKVDKSERARFGQPLSTADTGVTWLTSSRPSAVEYRDGHIRKTVITVPAFSMTTTAAAKAFGQRIYQFPEGHILPVAARVSVTSTPGDNTTGTGEVGLGTVVASGAAAVLSGTATFENILTGSTVANGTAATAQTDKATAAAGGTSGTQNSIDGSSTANKLFLNMAETFTGTGGVTVSAATVTLWWIDLGDA